MALIDLRPQAKRLTPAQMVKQLKSFSLDLKFSAGVWFFAPGGGRFHDRYVPAISLEEILEKAAGMVKYGLCGLEGHFPIEVNWDNYKKIKKYCKDAGLRFVGIAPFIFFDKQYEFGSLSSPIAKARRSAIKRTIETLEINKAMGTDFAIVWPGIDGYENSFGMDLVAARDRFADGLAEAMDTVPGIRIAIEPKPYEPRGHILYGTTPEAILLAEKVESRLRNPINKKLLKAGHALVGMNPEVGHVLMGYEDLPSALSLVMEYGRLMHTHWNSQPLGNYDQDLNVGVVAPEQAEAGLYALKMYGFKGYFGIDINPERMPVERALLNNFDALRAMNDRINGLNHDAVVAVLNKPEQNRGVLEAILTRARASSSRGLSPMPKVVK
jgi:xylose isomerase